MITKSISIFCFFISLLLCLRVNGSHRTYIGASHALNPQTIQFDPLPDRTFGDAPFTLTATSSAGLTVTFMSSDPSIVSIDGTTATILKAGSIVITASQNGDATTDKAPDVQQSLLIKKADQTISFSALPEISYSPLPFFLFATSSSGLPVSFSSMDPAVVSVQGSYASINIPGSTYIIASQSGNDNYNAASDVQQLFVIDKGEQTITFDSIYSKTYGDPDFDLAASTDFGSPVTFTIADPSIATINGSTVTILSAGTTTITAHQPGDSYYNPAPDVKRVLLVNQKSQAITFSPPAAVVYGTSFDLAATATSGLAVSYRSSNTSVATINGSIVTMVGTGNVTITASQAGNTNYAAAADVNRSINVIKSAQTITFGTLPSKTYGDLPFDITATSTSGLPVSFVSSDPTIAAITGNTITILAAGVVTITGSQSGNDNYIEAGDVARILNITKADPNLVFGPIADKTLGDDAFNLQATAKTPVTFSSSSANVKIVGSSLSMLSAGRVTVQAITSLSANYTSKSAQQQFCINPMQPTITATSVHELTSSADNGNQWYVDGKTIDGATGKKIQATKDGSYMVQVTIGGCSSKLSTPVVVVIAATEDPLPELSVNIFPNPSHDFFSIGIDNVITQQLQYQVIDPLGRLVLQSTGHAHPATIIDMRNQPAGIYIVKLQLGEGIVTKRLVKE